MSHFTVMVIGNDPEGQLAPFDENIEVEEYEKGPVSEEDKQSFLDYYNKEKGIKGTFDELYPLFGKEWNSNGYRKNEEGVWTGYSTYNPNSKWDWYCLGGRWSSMLKLKDGMSGNYGEPGVMMSKRESRKPGYADQALKGQVDWEAMRSERGRIAGETWDAVHKALDKTRETTGITVKWSALIDANLNESMTFEEKREKAKELRETYGNQPRVMAFRKFAQSEEGRKMIGWDEKLEDYDIPREEYVQKGRNSACTTFAILKDGEWIERGQMGWFGMAHNEMNEDQWTAKQNELIDSLPDNMLISIYDCHI